MLTIVDGECAMPVDPSTNSTCEFQTRNDFWPWITAVFCERSYLCLNTITSQTTFSPHLQHLFNSKDEALRLRGQQLRTKACIHLLSPFLFIKGPLITSRLWIPSRLFYFYFSFSCFSFMARLRIWLRICALVPSRFSSSKAKSTPWQVVSVPQRLTLEIQYGLPTYPQVEQGWDFPEVVLWHVNLQIIW